MENNDSKKPKKKFIGVYFNCCNIYQRIYVNLTNTGYYGYCPKCGKQVKFVIGKGGTNSRFFRAD